MRVPTAALLIAAEILTGFAWVPLNGQGSPPQGTRHTDLALSGIVTAHGGAQLVEWYHLGPYPPAASGNPPGYIRGVSVRAGTKESPVVADWRASPTTILAFYPKLNRLWTLPGIAGGDVISAAVQYGGRVVDLYMLRLDENRLLQVGHMEGEDLSVMRLAGRMVVEVVPDDYHRVPSLYAWDGHVFAEASREFPAFYLKLGASYVAGVHNPHPLPEEAIVQSCQLAMQAYVLARQPAKGRQACADARRRISLGQGLIQDLATESYQQFERERAAAVQRVDALLGGHARQM